MTEEQFSPGDPNGAAIRAAGALASAFRSPRLRRKPVVVVGVTILGLAALALAVALAIVLSH